MNILLLEGDNDRRQHILDAIDLAGAKLSIRFAQNVADVRTMARHDYFGVVLVGPGGPDNALAAVTFLRGWFPSALIVAYDAFAGYQQGRENRIIAAGANSFFDFRYSAMKIAMLLRPLLGRDVGRQASSPDRAEAASAH